MKLRWKQNLAAAVGLVIAVTVMPPPRLQAQAWTPPTPEELAMKSVPEVPGAPAIYLYREEDSDDREQVLSFYFRVKVFSDGGKDLANIEIPFVSGSDGFKVSAISGRTIHPDGTIVPYSGKIEDKLIKKSHGGATVKAKVFTLPSVEVGSILEYRYKIHYSDEYAHAPDWYVQQDLFVRKAHYSWLPTAQALQNSNGDYVSHIGWFALLPDGAKVQQDKKGRFELDVSDVMPTVEEDYSPPMKSVSHRVLFYYLVYKSESEFWEREGKLWAQARDRFIGPNAGVRAATQALVAPGDTDEQKLRKIYAAVMAMENTRFTRARTAKEEQAAGLKEVESTDDVLARKRGTDDQLTELFVAMARAAGMKAYLGAIADRSQRIFLPGYLSLSQLDDYLAIVNVNGKEVTFDPGQRYCTYGQVSWRHVYTGGLRETETGTTFMRVPPGDFKADLTQRTAALKIEDDGMATGVVMLTYLGDAALEWRHDALSGDRTALEASLKTELEHMLPVGVDVTVSKIDNLEDGEKPLIVTYAVHGPVGTSTGKRLLLPTSLFENRHKPRFPGATREVGVDFKYPYSVQDAVRYTLPPLLDIESAPPAQPDVTKLKNTAGYQLSARHDGNGITVYRSLANGKIFYDKAEYPELKTFFATVESHDHDTLVLTRKPPASKSSDGSGN
jgi:hypothetical protein